MPNHRQHVNKRKFVFVSLNMFSVLNRMKKKNAEKTTCGLMRFFVWINFLIESESCSLILVRFIQNMWIHTSIFAHIRIYNVVSSMTICRRKEFFDQKQCANINVNFTIEIHSVMRHVYVAQKVCGMRILYRDIELWMIRYAFFSTRYTQTCTKYRNSCAI